LIVDNEGIDSEVDATALPMPGPITSTALTPTVLTDAFATFPALEGLTFTSAAGNGTPNLGDDTLYRVVASTPTTLKVPGGDLTAGGPTFSALYVFDNVEIRGRAKVRVERMRVLSGDLASGDATTLALDGQLSANVLDVNAVGQLAMSAGGGAGLAVTTLV